MCAKSTNIAHTATSIVTDFAMPTQVHPGNTINTLLRECSETSRDAYVNARSSSSNVAPPANPLGTPKGRWIFDPRNGAALRAPFELYIPLKQWNFNPYTGLAWTPSLRQLASIPNQYASSVAVSAPFKVISTSATAPLSQTNALMSASETPTVAPPSTRAVAEHHTAARPFLPPVSALVSGPLTTPAAPRHPTLRSVAFSPAALISSADSSPAAFNPSSTHCNQCPHRSLPRRLRPASLSPHARRPIVRRRPAARRALLAVSRRRRLRRALQSEPNTEHFIGSS